MKNERYYYRILSKEEQEIYRAIYEGIRKQDAQIVVTSHLTPAQIFDVYFKVLYDDPLLYFVNQRFIQINSLGNQRTLVPSYLYPPKDIENINREIDNVLRKIDVKAQTLLSDPFRLEKYLHDSLVKSVAYNYDSVAKADYCLNAHSILGAFLEHTAVCEGIAKAFKLLCNRYGMKCIVVLGDVHSVSVSGNPRHAWNLVKVGNESYYVDVTWDSNYIEKRQYVTYEYFNLTTEDISKDHRPEGTLPVCTDVRLNYYHCTGSIVGSEQELKDLIRKRINDDKIMFKAKVGSPDFPTMNEVKAKAIAAYHAVSGLRKDEKQMYSCFHETQQTGSLLFP